MSKWREIIGALLVIYATLPKKLTDWFWEFVRAKIGESIWHWLESYVMMLSTLNDFDWFRIVLVAAGVVLLWPTIKELAAKWLTYYGWSYVPFTKAALSVHEGLEDAGIRAVGEDDDPIQHFKYAFLSLDGSQLRGAKPPSTKLRLIPRQDFGALYPLKDGDELHWLYDRSPAYVRVEVSRKDIRRAINLHKKFAAIAP